MGAAVSERYELGELVASGGMADVYRGYDRRLARRVAIKRLRGAMDDAAARERFARESRLLAGFSHPHAVAVYDAADTDLGPVIVMEYVEGPTLRAHVEAAGCLPVEEAVTIADELLGALAAAHAAGIVHRDVKPANVLDAPDGHVKLADIGIATMADASDLTVAGSVLGTPRYLSPEQMIGKPATPRSDVYSAGVVLSEMVGGPTALADAPDWYVVIVERALAQDPAQRYPDAGAMRTALRAGARGDVTVADSTVTLPIVVEPLGRATPDRRRGLWAVVLFVVVGALIATGVWALGDRDGPTAVVPDPTVPTLPTTVTPLVTTPAPAPTAAPAPVVTPGGGRKVPPGREKRARG
jgi:serine/threonine protein kinase